MQSIYAAVRRLSISYDPNGVMSDSSILKNWLAGLNETRIERSYIPFIYGNT